MYVCMYVPLYLQAHVDKPTHIEDSLPRWPSRRFSESTVGEGTAIAWMSPCWFATSGGHVCIDIYIYIYIVCVIVGMFSCC